MRKTLLTAAAVALSASVANAAFLLGADDNDHKAVIAQSQAEGTVSSYAAAIALERSGTVTPGFLLGADENDHKLWINQTAR